MSRAAEVPAWLCAALPGHDWQEACRCSLKVGPEGAGLQLEATAFGYLVEGVDEGAGQDVRLRAGSTLVAIGEEPLLGLDEDALDEACGRHFCDGAALLVVPEAELRVASEQAAGRGQLLRVPLGGRCGAELRAALLPDLVTFAARAGVMAQLLGGDSAADSACVLLAGARDKVCAARGELGQLLSYHRRAANGSVAGAATADMAPTVEVDGTVIRSLPARGRRRRAAPEAQEDGAEGAGGGGGTDGGDGAAAPSGKVAKMDEAASLQPVQPELHQYEYMDHTADVILHSWGTSLEQAVGQVCVAFFAYMTDLQGVALERSFEVEASGHDMVDMLYHLLDELLFHFGTQFVMCRRVEVLELDVANRRVRVRGFGAVFDLAKHTQGTEIKAITMHQMKILTPDTVTTEQGVHDRKSDNMEGGKAIEGFPYECYVLVDI